MLVENQKIEMTWSRSNCTWYKQKGYVFTKCGDKFIVNVKDLKHGSHIFVKVVCDYCGEEFYIRYNLHYKNKIKNQKDACNKCALLKASEQSLEKRAKKAFSVLYDICEEKHYILLTNIKEYTGNKMKIKYICPKHGIQETPLVSLKCGNGCKKCGYEKVSEKLKYSQDEVEEIINSVNGNILLNKNEYVEALKNNLKIKCKCGEVFTTSLAAYMRYNVNRCRKCSKKETNGELLISSILNKYNILYTKQEDFNGDCHDVRSLSFDFYLPKYNTCIEFDGQQHFEPIFGEDKFKYTLLHDGMKTNYCKWNDIKLIRIPYYKSQYIENILNEELNFTQQKQIA